MTKNTTSIAIHADYRAAFWAGNTFKGWVQCQSKGLLEEDFLQNLASFFKKNPKEKEGVEQIIDPAIIDTIL